MPKNPLKFARRKSSGNVLDEIPSEPVTPAVSSFRVLERPEKAPLNGERGSQDRVKKVNRPFQSPLSQLRGRSAEELGVGVNRCVDSAKDVRVDWLLKRARGSGGTTASGSSGYDESSSASARHSSSSTLPSSVDAEEELFARRSKTSPMYHNISSNVDDRAPPRPSFTARAARAFSFGQNHNRNSTTVSSVPPPLPPLPINGVPGRPERSHSPPQRERAMTTSSYASTAVPTKPEVSLSLGSSDFGSEFTSMFDSPTTDRYRTPPPPPPPPKAAYHRTVCTNDQYTSYNTNTQQESEPMFPPRTHSRQAFQNLPEELKNLRDDSGSPYSWDRRGSNEGLMLGSPMSSPQVDEFGAPPPPPPHGSGMAPAFLGKGKAGYSLVPDRHSPGLERLSQDSQTGFYVNGTDKKDAAYDTNEEDPWVKRVELRDPQGPESASSHSFTSESSRSATLTQKPVSGSTNGPPVTRKPLGMPSQATAGASRSGAMSPDPEADLPLCGSESSNTTPRAAKLELPNLESESMFDSSPLGPASRAIKPRHMRTESGTPKKMTKAQFERLQRRGDTSGEQSDEEENLADDYDDDDDVERAKKMSKQRQKQEANMSVYRQQMKKVTGGGPTDLPSMPRPNLDRAAASAPAGGILHLGGVGGQPSADSVRGKQTEDDDEDVPLGILQAHGFPGAGRPPTRQGENDATARRGSVAGSVAGGGAGEGNLPPFARRLPADPYFGASVVNPSHRESLGMNSPGSVYGVPPSMPPPMIPPMQPQMGHPGGLVGVIAGEERAKAARRGSPNPATGAFIGVGAMQPHMAGMLGMGGGRTMTMPNMAAPSVYSPSGMGANPMMPQMPMMQQMPNPQQQQQDQMQKFMEMQMQVMQNMLAMQQTQTGQTPQPQQQTQDYLGVPLGGSPGQGAPSIRNGQGPNQNRAMTMMHPPTRWDFSPGPQRPNSAMPTTYAPSGMNGNGPGPGYSQSIAPTERSNVGQPSRYRPVTVGVDGTGRTQSMTSSLTLNAFASNNKQPPMPTVSTPQAQQKSHSTVRLIDKPKGTPKVTTKAVAADEDDDEGWAEMRKKREDKKKFRFGKRETKNSDLSDIYQNFD